jgi:hypothetical protein
VERRSGDLPERSQIGRRRPAGMSGDSAQLSLNPFAVAFVDGPDSQRAGRCLREYLDAFVARAQRGKQLESYQHPELVSMRQAALRATGGEVRPRLLPHEFNLCIGRSRKAADATTIHRRLGSAPARVRAAWCTWSIDSDSGDVNAELRFQIGQVSQHGPTELLHRCWIKGCSIAEPAWR